MRFLRNEVFDKVEEFLWYIQVWVSDVLEKSFFRKGLEKKAWLSEKRVKGMKSAESEPESLDDSFEFFPVIGSIKMGTHLIKGNVSQWAILNVYILMEMTQ